jgi:hypothetical protein
MTFGITPQTVERGTPQPPFLKPETQVINFTGNVTVTRGVGERANVITVRGPDAPTDPLGDYVTLLLHAEGNDGQQVFYDDSQYHWAYTKTSTVFNSTTQKVAGTSSIKANAISDYIQYVDNDLFDCSGDFTVECFVLVTATSPNDQMLLSKFGISPNSGWFFQMLTPSPNQANIGFQIASASGLNSVTTTGLIPLTFNAWHHVAVTRSGNVYRTFLDGVKKNEQTHAEVIFTNTTPIRVCGDVFYSINTFRGYVDEVRFTSGIARYVADFTVPVVPFPNP